MKQHPVSETLFSPRRIDEILDQASFCRLACHLANHCIGKGVFIGSEGAPVIRDLRKGTLLEKVNSTWKSITCYEPFDPKPFSLVVYDRHPVELTSTWAAVDFDWHQDQDPMPHHWAVLQRLTRVAEQYQQEGTCDALIVELSGRGAHLWLLSRTAHAVSHWHKQATKLLSDANCSGLPGLELYPATTRPSSRGHALRLPGSVSVMRFNPRDGCPISEIVAHRGLLELAAQLPDPPSNNKSIYIGRAKATELPGKDAKARAQAKEAEWLAKHAIVAPRTRHNRARALIVAAAFFRPTEEVMQLCEKLHQLAPCRPVTPLEEHLQDCRRMLDDWLAKVSKTLLTPEEQQRMGALEHPRHMVVFHAIHNFHRLALIEGKDDVAISSEALGCAIGTSYKTALEDLKHFIDFGILERAVPAVRGRSCTRYRWLLPHLSGKEIRQRWSELGRNVRLPI